MNKKNSFYFKFIPTLAETYCTIMSKNKIALTVAEQIDRAKDGRTQRYIIEKMKAAGIEMNDVRFSNKKNGPDSFTPEELKALSQILGTEIVA